MSTTRRGTIQTEWVLNANVDSLKVANQKVEDLRNTIISLRNNLTEADFTPTFGNNAKQALGEVKRTLLDLSGVLQKSYNSSLGSFNFDSLRKGIDKIGLDKITTQMNSIGKEGQAAWLKMESAIISTTGEIRKTETVLDKMGKTMINTVKWGITSSIMHSFTGEVQRAYGYVKELDTSLNDIRIVTGKSAEEMERFAEKANKAAMALGKSTTDYTEASLIYYQQGLSDKEVEARTGITLKAANVTGQSASEVSEQLTAVWNGYNASAAEAEIYVDRLAAVAANSASNLEELSVGMSKVASAANAMGVGEEQLAAQISTIISTTRQAPESVGTALKTIYARMSDIKMGSEDAEITLGNYTQKMADMGVNVLNANGQLRDMGEVVEEIGTKWAYMSKEQQVALAQTMAGTRQYNNLIALFDNWDQYTRMLNIASNATGTLQDQQDIYMESVAAHLQEAKTAWEDFKDSILSEDIIKVFADFSKTIGEVAANVVDGLGGTIPTFVLLASTLTQLFNKTLTQEAGNMFQNMRQSQVEKDKMEARRAIVTQFRDSRENNGGFSGQAEAIAQAMEKGVDFSNFLSPEENKAFMAMLDDFLAKFKEIASLEESFTEEQKKRIENLYGKHTGEAKKFEDITSEELEAIEETYGEAILKTDEVIERSTEIIDKIDKKIEKLTGDLEEATKKQEELEKGATAASDQNIDKIQEKIDLITKSKKNVVTQQAFSKTLIADIEKTIPQLNVNEGALEINEKKTGIVLSGAAQRALKEFEDTRDFQTGGKKNIDIVKDEKENDTQRRASYSAIQSALKKFWEQVAQDLEDAKKVEAEQAKEQIEKMKTDPNSELGKATANVKDIKEKINKKNSRKEKASNIRNNKQNERNKDEETSDFVENTKKSKKSVEDMNEDLEKTNDTINEVGGTLDKVNFEEQFQGISLGVSSVAGLATNFFMLTSSLKTVKTAIEEGNFSFSTILTLVSQVGFAIPGLIGSFNNLKNSLDMVKISGKSLSSLIESNPYLLAIAAAFAAIAGTIAFAVKKQKEYLDGLIEEGKAIQEENEKLKGLNSEYERLYENYKETGESKQELVNKANELSEALEDERLALLANSGQWEEYNKILEEDLTQKAKDDTEALAKAFEASKKEAKNWASFWENIKVNPALKLIANILLPGLYTWIERITDLVENWDLYVLNVTNQIKRLKSNIENSHGLLKFLIFDYWNNLFTIVNGVANKADELIKKLQNAIPLLKIISAIANPFQDLDKFQASTQEQQKKGDAIQKKYNIYSQYTGDYTADKKNYDNIQLALEEARKTGATEYATYLETISKVFEANLQGVIDAASTKIENELNANDYFSETDSYSDYLEQREAAIAEIQKNNPEATREEIEDIIDSWAKDNKDLTKYASQLTNAEGLKLKALNNIKASFIGEEANFEVIDEKTGDLTKEAEKNVNRFIEYISKDSDKITLIAGLEFSKEDYAIIEKYGDDVAGAYNEIFNRNADTIRSNFEEQSAKDVSNLATSLIKKMQSGDITEETLSTDEDYGALKDYLSQIKALYPDLIYEANLLNETWAAGTQDYLIALNNVEEKMRDLQLNSDLAGRNTLVDNLDKRTETVKKTRMSYEQNFIAAGVNKDIRYSNHSGNSVLVYYTGHEGTKEIEHEYEETQTVTVDLDINDTKLQEALEDIMEADYAIDVEIHANAEDDFDESITAMEKMKDMAGMIGDRYLVAADDVRELNNVFPGILENAQYMADGTVKLNQDIAKSAMESAQTEIDVDKQATIKNLQNDATILRGKQKVYQHMADVALKAAEGEMKSDVALAEIKSDLQSKEMTQSVEADKQKMFNTKEVADTNAKAALASSKNWGAAYQSQTSNAAIWGQTNAAAARAGETGVFSPPDGMHSIQVDGFATESTEVGNVKDIEDALENNPNSANEIWKKYAESYQSLADSAGDKANDIEGMIAELTAAYNEASNQITNSGKGKGSGDSDFINYLKDERDRYHDINIAIEGVEHALKRLSSQQEKLMGKSLAKNLMAQTEQLQKQVFLSKEKLKIQEQEAQKLRTKLSEQGVEFNDDGTIANYGTLLAQKLDYVNEVTEKYNLLSKSEQKRFKSTVEQAQKDYENLQKNIENYDKLISNEIPELEQKVQDLTDQKINLQIQAFAIEIEAKLDLAEAEKQWNEFLQKVVYKDTTPYGNAQRDRADLLTYYNNDGSGIINADIKSLKEKLAQLKEIEEKGVSTVYGDNKTKLLEDLKAASDQLMKHMEELEDLADKVKQDYLDAIDAAANAFETLNKDFEQTTSIIQHDMKIIQDLYGDDYEAMDKYYNKQEENYNNQLAAQRKNVDYWKDLMDKEEKGSDAWKKYKENWENAVNTLNSTVESSIQNLLDKYENTINKIMKDMNDKLTGGLGLNYANEEWDLINKQSDLYLDNIESAYETSQLQAKYLKAINDTSSVTAQKKLNDLMEDEISMLKEKDKLTKYDIDRANAKYDLALKQIALEEAQQNKSQMRLRRDSQGNYRYQYVANNDNIDNAQGEYDKALNNLYEMDKEQYKSNLDQVFSYYKEWQDKMAEAAKIKDDEERERMYDLYNNYYGNIINGLVEENETAKLNLYESTELSLEDYFKDNVEAFNNMTEQEKQAWMGEEGLVPQMQSTVADLVAAFADPETGFPYISDVLLDNLKDATEEYKNDLGDLQTAADLNFESIRSGIDDTIGTMGGLIEQDKEEYEEQKKQLQKTREINEEVKKLLAQYALTKQAGIDAATAAGAAWSEQKNDVENLSNAIIDMINNINNMINSFKDMWQEARNTASYYQQVSSSMSSSSSNSSATSSGSPLGSPTASKKQSHKFMLNSRGTNGYTLTQDESKVFFNTSGGGTIEQIISKIASISGLQSFEAKNFVQNALLKNIGKTVSLSFDTGGYTGDWNSKDGKLAMLHSKELVLNKKDTENILTAVSTVRDMSSLLDSLKDSMLNRISNISGLGSISLGGIAAGDKTVQQEVHITANFEGETTSDAIQTALTNLVNVASQHAFDTRR